MSRGCKALPAAMSAAASLSPRSKLSLYLDLIRWNRPAGWLVLVWPTLGALWVAADGFPGWHLFTVFVLGTVLMRSAGCTINERARRRLPWLWQDLPAQPLQPRTRHGLLAVGAGAALLLALVGWGVHASHAAQPPRGLMALDLAVQQGVAAVLPHALVPLVKLWTLLGDLKVMGLISLAVALWLLWRRQGLQLVAWVSATAGAGLWVRVIKPLVGRERPLDGLVQETGFSFPSGHSAGTAAVFGMLAWLAVRRLPAQQRPWAVALAAVLAVGTGVSRVLLSVHYASDVLAGLLLGLAWVVLVVWVADRAEYASYAARPLGARDRARSAVPEQAPGKAQSPVR